jgi:tight adherence protein B
MAVTGVFLADVLTSGGIGLLLAGAMGVGIVMLFVGLQRAVDAHSRNSVVQRFDRFVNVAAPAVPESGTRRRRRERRGPSYAAAFDATRSSRSFTVTLARDLARADLKLTVSEYMIISVLLASLGALIGLAMPFAGRILLAAILLGLGFYLPRYYVTRQRLNRQRAFNGQLADIITLMANALRAGYSLLQAMELAAREGTEPASKELERVVREVGLGLSPEEALANLVERMQSEDLDLLVTAINVQREVGGNLVEVLDTIATTIRERVKLKGEIRVLTAQQQFSGYIIALLPVVLALILGIMNPSYMLGVFTDTVWCGWTMLSCSLAMILAGFLIIRQIVDIKV